jgi:hypothetical protein
LENGMSDEQIWSLVVTVGSIAGTVIASVWVAAWWLKSQLVGGQIAGLKAENDNLRAQVGSINASREVLEQRRLLAEEQRKKSADDLLNVNAKLETAMAQINQHASAQALSMTIETARISTSSAIAANTATGTFLKPEKGVIHWLGPGELDKQIGELDKQIASSKRGDLDLTQGSGDLNWNFPGRGKK